MTYEEYLEKVVNKNKAFTEEEGKHDCENCMDRAGIPCLKAYRCKRFKEGKNEQEKTNYQ